MFKLYLFAFLSILSLNLGCGPKRSDFAEPTPVPTPMFVEYFQANLADKPECLNDDPKKRHDFMVNSWLGELQCEWSCGDWVSPDGEPGPHKVTARFQRRVGEPFWALIDSKWERCSAL